MVVVKLMGGLGNQLFQYSFGRYLSHIHHTDLILDDSFYIDTPISATSRVYELGNFPIHGRTVTAAERNMLRTYSGGFWKLLRRLVPLPGKLKYIYDYSTTGPDNYNKFVNNVYLDGYWQSSKYLYQINKILRSELIPIIPMSACDLNFKSEIERAGDGAISLHIRRGDFISNNTVASSHGVCSIDYYLSSMDYMTGRIANPKFFIFSDDIDWAKENFKYENRISYIDKGIGGSAVQDLHLMMQCKHHIVANSTFSWWGAWLGYSIGQIVTRPKLWSLEKPEIGDLICPSVWVAL